MLRLIALTLLVAIAAPAGLAREQDKENPRQTVSDCDHRANEQNLKNGNRWNSVAACASRYPATGDARRDRYRECHAGAADRGLHGASRRQYIEDCVADRLQRRTLVMLGG